MKRHGSEWVVSYRPPRVLGTRRICCPRPSCSQRRVGDRGVRRGGRRPRLGDRATPLPSARAPHNGRHRLAPRLCNNSVGGGRPLECDPRRERARCTAELVAQHHRTARGYPQLTTRQRAELQQVHTTLHWPLREEGPRFASLQSSRTLLHASLPIRCGRIRYSTDTAPSSDSPSNCR